VARATGCLVKQWVHPNTNHKNEEEHRAGADVLQHNNALLGTLTHRLVQEEVFDRDRKAPETRALALLLHHAGLSCRRTSQLVTLLAEPVSHNPISAWHRRASHLFREQPVQRHERLVIDETSLHIEKPRETWPEDCDKDAGDHLIELFLWAAVDPDTQQLVHVAVSQGRSSVEAMGFVKGVVALCDNRPVIHVDRGVWYPWPLEALGLDWQVTAGGVRNTVETWFGLLKERIGQFRRRWPANASRGEVEAWVEGFAWLFNQDPSTRLT
jgi:putative transposase